MEEWQDWRTGQPKHLGDLWTLEKNGHRAVCALVGHPLGTEARVVVDNDVQRTEAFRDQKTMLDVTTAWREAFEEKGWRTR